jgi:hypothetical protein
MSRAMHPLFRVGWVAFMAASVALACTNNPPDLPPQLGNCIPVGDSGCKGATSSSGGGGSPGGEDGGDSGTGEGEGGGVLGCGMADAFLTPTNVTGCHTCIQTNCCQADTACTGECLNLLQCMLGCQADPLTEPTCIPACTNNSPNGIAAYNDFQACLVAFACEGAGCPALPSTNGGDF